MKNPSFDLNTRILDFDNEKVTINYFSSLCSGDMVAYLVEGITNHRGKTLKDCINNGDVKEEPDVNKAQYALLTGCAVVTYRNIQYVLDTRFYPSRSIEEPETEKSVRGSKDGFNESILTCVGLIRRRIRTIDLVMNKQTIGKDNPLDICICYLDNQVDKQILQHLLDRIKEIKNEDLVMSDRALEEMILDQGYNPFPLVRYSERPDVVSTHILHGHIAIICDTSSSVLMLPTTLFEILEHVEEHRQTPLIGTFIRLIRMAAVFLSIYLVPIFALCSSFLKWDYSFFIQILIVELSIELLRIATVHTPQSLSNAMGLIAAILLYGKNFFSVLVRKISNIKLTNIEKKSFLIMAFSLLISNVFSMIMPLNESFLVNNLIADEVITANYKVANLIPSQLAFVTSSIVIYYFPIIAKESGRAAVWKKAVSIGKWVGALIGVISIVGIVITPIILQIVYGDQYSDARLISRMLWIAYGLNAGFRMFPMNVLPAIGCTKYNVIISGASCVVHFILDYIFIQNWGIYGVVYATGLVYLGTGFLYWYYLAKQTILIRVQ